jgi:hypothetical protein
MAGIIIYGLKPELDITGDRQGFKFGGSTLPPPIGSFNLDNAYIPSISSNSLTNFEFRNNTLSGFRFLHETSTTDTIGQLKLKSFVGASPTGTDILTFGNDGSINFISPLVMNSNLNMNNFRITSVATPILGTDAINKDYADSVISGTVTLSGAITGTGAVGTNIITTLSTVGINKLAGYPTDSSLFLRGDGNWSNNFAKIGVNMTPTDTGVIQFANGDAVSKIILNKDAPANSFDLAGIGFVATAGVLYHTPIGKGHYFYNGAGGNLGLAIGIQNLTLGYALQGDDFRKMVLYEGLVTPNANQTYAIGLEPIDGSTNLFRNQVANINDAFNWGYGINTVSSGQFMRLNSTSLDIFNKRVKNSLDPVDAQDLATKNYVDLAIDNSFGSDVALPFAQLKFNWSYLSITNPTTYFFTNVLTDAQPSKNFKYQVTTSDLFIREWEHEYSLIGDSNLNGIYKLNYNAPSYTSTPFRVDIYPFTPTQNVMTIAVPINMGGFEIKNALNPTTAQSLATKNYVDTAPNQTITLTGAVTGTGTSSLATTLAASQTVTGTTETFNYSNILTSSIFSILNTNAACVTRFRAGTSNDYVQLGYDGANGESFLDITGGSNNSLEFRVNSVGIGTFLDSGIFGIGTTTPSFAKLQINGGVTNIGAEETALRVIGGQNAVKIELQSTAVGGKLYEMRSNSTGAFDITDRTGGVTRYSIDTTGNHIFSNTIYGRRASGVVTMQNNATATSITTGGVFVKVAGSTTSSNLNAVTASIFNRITSSSATIGLVHCTVTAFHSGPAGDEITFALYRNGIQLANTLISAQNSSVPQTFAISTIVSMAANDYIELWCTHPTSARTITVKNYMMSYTTT